MLDPAAGLTYRMKVTIPPIRETNAMHDPATIHLYHGARGRGQRGQFWSALTGRPRRLLALAEVETSRTGPAHDCARIRTVPISQIQGSQGRSHDFDRDFNPLQDHNRERWLSVAKARRRGKTLPAVTLIQIGDVYFVADGHHRISVARALGQQHIEAKVTVWKVTGPLPRQEQKRDTVYHPILMEAFDKVLQEAGKGRLAQVAKASQSKRHEHLPLSVGEFLISFGLWLKTRLALGSAALLS